MAQHIGIELFDDKRTSPTRSRSSTMNAIRCCVLVDPYGNTILSSYQMVGLLAELQARLAETGDSSLAALPRRLIECFRATDARRVAAPAWAA